MLTYHSSTTLRHIHLAAAIVQSVISFLIQHLQCGEGSEGFSSIGAV